MEELLIGRKRSRARAIHTEPLVVKAPKPLKEAIARYLAERKPDITRSQWIRSLIARELVKEGVVTEEEVRNWEKGEF